MDQLRHRFEKVFIHEESWSSPVADRLRGFFPADVIERVNQQPLKEKRGPLSASDFSQSKRLLYLAPYAGDFFKRCPGSRPGLMCCNYFVLNLGLQCDMNCSYCYLQSFINTPTLTVYSNIEKALDELRRMHQDLGAQRVRVGTGEVIDSLSLDPITLYSRDLIRTFRDFPQWTVEFKTKSSYVRQFLDEPHSGNVIVSWSLNPQALIDREEHQTASLAERLFAARICLDKGFQISFHLDPVIWHPQWKENYRSLVDAIVTQFKPTDLPYLSVGTLRFQPEQRHIMRERFGWKSLINRAEVFPSSDGKLRYDRSLRTEMFQFILDRFKAHSSEWRLFLCMETPETWNTTMGQMPQKDESIKDLFSSDVLRRFNQWSLNSP